jgi:hypothetical protein
MLRGANSCNIESYASAAGFTTSKRFGGVSAASETASTTNAGAPADVKPTDNITLKTTQVDTPYHSFILFTFSNHFS